MRDEIRDISWMTPELMDRYADKMVFVFGDNLERRGTGGGAMFRYYDNSYGFVTKKAPRMDRDAFFRRDEYLPVLKKETEKLEDEIIRNKNVIYLISKLGTGLAMSSGRYYLWPMIWKRLVDLRSRYRNVSLMWESRGAEQ